MTQAGYDFASHRIASHRMVEDNCALFASCKTHGTEYRIRDG